MCIWKLRIQDNGVRLERGHPLAENISCAKHLSYYEKFAINPRVRANASAPGLASFIGIAGL